MLERSCDIVRTAFVATYPPRRCGIATFTHDLASVTENREIAVIHPTDERSSYSFEVHHRIREDVAADYVSVARALNTCVDVVSVQHEYGIWAGDDGSSVLDFVRELRVPAVATLHTVLREPSAGQRAILSELANLTDATVVMSRAAADLLATVYGIDGRRVKVIPHGVPNLPLVDSATVKPSLGLEGRDVILSFGLLGPGKGYELVIEALPAVVEKHPDVLYVILGATHPALLKREGEAYRERLMDQVGRLGLADHVRFIDRFVNRVELTQWLEASDLSVTPYPNLGQIASGTLSYAMSAGRPVVSTPYTYAAELLSGGRGVLFEPGSAASLAGALNALLGDAALRTEIGQRAYAYSRQMIWSAVGAEYGALFEGLGTGRRATVPTGSMITVNA